MCKSGGGSCARVRRVSPHTIVVPISTMAATLRRRFMVLRIPGPQLVEMLNHVVVFEQIEILDDVIVGEQANVRAAQLLLQLELIDAGDRQTSGAMMYHDRDREHR